ncbi:transmembrane channel-like protein 2 [Cricetulus griseus]|nr:transmembrane channel-like protein 2 [Cricetulus griseus]
MKLCLSSFVYLHFNLVQSSPKSTVLREVEKNHKSIKGRAIITNSEDTLKNSSKNATQLQLTKEEPTSYSPSQIQTMDKKVKGPGSSSTNGRASQPTSRHLVGSQPPRVRPDSGQPQSQTYICRSASGKSTKRPHN